VCLRKSKSLLNEYLGLKDLKEASECLAEIKSPGFHWEFVREAVNLVLEKKDSERDLVVNLIVELTNTFKQLTPAQNAKGFADVLEFIEDLAIDIPNAKPFVVSMCGKLIAAGALDAKFLPAALAAIDQGTPEGAAKLLADIKGVIEAEAGADALAKIVADAGI